MNNNNAYTHNNQILLYLYSNEDNISEEEKKHKYNQYLKGLRTLAYKGHPEAQVDLAAHYEDVGFWGLQNPYYNFHKIFYWYSKASDNNNATACNNLAAMYISGNGCAKDIHKAISLYEKAIDLDNAANYVKENYSNIINKVNCAMLSQLLLDVVDESILIDFLAEKKQIISKWNIDCYGHIQKLASIEEVNNYFKNIFYQIEKDMIEKTFVMNKYRVKKIICINFPNMLMKNYHWYKSQTDQKKLSKIEYLKYNTMLYTIKPLQT
ncbi:MAG: sel1 repeat family protein [Prevotellaceae bacterium]|jgi:TPR repeat protein|nr:sel1 repeat family protein [Prevotellaceae bacterium]